MDGWNTILEKSREHFEEIFDLFSVEAVEKGEVCLENFISFLFLCPLFFL